MFEGVIFKNKDSKETFILLSKLAQLKEKLNTTKNKKEIPSIKKEYENYFSFLVKKFSYIPEIHTKRYMKYSNYHDLLQEGNLGLVIALNKFDMKRSNNFFRLANQYVKTRVKRAANKFDVINVPISIGKEKPFYRVEMPNNMIADSFEKSIESKEMYSNVKSFIMGLADDYKKILGFYYGFCIKENQIVVSDSKLKICDISRQLNIPRVKVKKVIDSANKKMLSCINC